MTGNEPPEVFMKNEEAILADHDAEGSHLADGIPGGVESLVSCPPPFHYKHLPLLCCMCVVFLQTSTKAVVQALDICVNLDGHGKGDSRAPAAKKRPCKKSAPKVLGKKRGIVYDDSNESDEE